MNTILDTRQQEQQVQLQTAPIEPIEPTFLRLGTDPDEAHRSKAEANNGLVQWVDQEGTVFTAFDDTPDLKDTLSAQGIVLGEMGSVGGVEISNAKNTQEKQKLTLARARQVGASLNKLAVERGLLGRVVQAQDGSEVVTPDPFDSSEIRLLDSSEDAESDFYTVFDNVDGAPVSPDRQGYIDGVGKFTEVGGIITYVTPEGKIQSVADCPFARDRLSDLRYTKTAEITGRYGNPKAGDEDAHQKLYWLLKDSNKE